MLTDMKQLSKADLKYLHGLSLCIGTPMYGGLAYAHYINSLLYLFRLCERYGIAIRLHATVNESLIHRARCSIADDFMSSKDTHLMWIDGDIGFDPLSVIELLLQRKEIIGAAYPMKAILWDRVKRAVEAGKPDRLLAHMSGNFSDIQLVGPPVKRIDIFKTYPVVQLSTGFMCIKRSAFEIFQRKYPTETCRNNFVRGDDGRLNTDKRVWLYFNTGVDVSSGVLLSEDFWFCAKMRTAGVEVSWAPWISLTHTGTYKFEGCFFCSAGQYIHE